METRFEALQKQIDTRFDALQKENEARQKQNDAQFKALMAAIGESHARAELETFRGLSALSERIAVLESARH